MSGSGEESDGIEFVGTKKVTIELLDDTDDDDDDKKDIGAAKKAIPVNCTSSSSARKRSLSGVARAPSSPSKQRAHSLLGKSAHEAINLCEDRSDAVMPTSRRSGPFATMTHHQGRSQEMAIALDDSSSSSSSSSEEDSDSDESSIVFVDKAGKEIPPTVILSSGPEIPPTVIISSLPPNPYNEDSSDDDMTTLREVIEQRGHRAHAAAAATTATITASKTAATTASKTSAPTATTASKTASKTATSPDRNQLREARRAEMTRRHARESIPSPARKKTPASVVLKAVPTMGKSAKAMQKHSAIASRPDVIILKVSTEALRVLHCDEDMPASSDDDDDDDDELSNRYLKRTPDSSLPVGSHSNEKLHAAMEVDNNSVAASDAPTDGSVRDGTVCLEDAEEYGDFAVNDFGQYDEDDNDNDRPLDCTFDDDTVVSVMRPTRRARRSPTGNGAVDDSADKENDRVVRRPMKPAATDRRLQAFADYDLVGMRDNETVAGDDDEDSLPEDLFDNLGIDDCVSMNLVDRLSSLSEDPKTGLPVRRFTVHGGEDGKVNENGSHV
jgi:hypothetical protein